MVESEASEARPDLMAGTLTDQLCLMSALVFSLTTPQTSLRNTSRYPPCALDGDCQAGHACMQYMCYPHTSVTGFRSHSYTPAQRVRDHGQRG